MMFMMRFTWMSSPESSPTFLPVAQHGHPLADAHHFLHVRGNEQHRHALRAQVWTSFSISAFRAHIDAARRLIQDDQLRLHREPAGEQHFLLVAAGQILDRRLGARAF